MFVLPQDYSKHKAWGVGRKNHGKHHQLYSEDGKSNTVPFKLSTHCDQHYQAAGPCKEQPPALLPVTPFSLPFLLFCHADSQVLERKQQPARKAALRSQGVCHALTCTRYTPRLQFCEHFCTSLHCHLESPGFLQN